MQRIRNALSTAPVVSVIRLFGPIAPPNGRYQAGVINYQVVKPLLTRAFKERRLAAVALRINSPGGWPAQCDLIRNEVARLADKRGVPVLAFVEDMAASGGYYLACCASQIYANRHSMVGSIGAIGIHFDLQAALREKASLAITVHRAGMRKMLGSNLESESPESLKATRYLLEGIHSGFIQVVKAARGDRLKGSPESDLFEGDIWLAPKAQQLGLIDGIADLEEVVAQKFGPKTRLVDVRPRVWEQLGGGFGDGSASSGLGQRLLGLTASPGSLEVADAASSLLPGGPLRGPV